MKEYQWYADHPTLGEIQIHSTSVVHLFMGRKATLFSPRMAGERLRSKPGTDQRRVEGLELAMGNLGLIDPGIRQECTIEVRIDGLAAAALAVCCEIDTEEHPEQADLLKAADAVIGAWVVKAWDDRTRPVKAA